MGVLHDIHDIVGGAIEQLAQGKWSERQVYGCEIIMLYACMSVCMCVCVCVAHYQVLCAKSYNKHTEHIHALEDGRSRLNSTAFQIKQQAD